MRYWEIVGSATRGRGGEFKDIDLVITVILTADEFAAATIPLLESKWMPSVSRGLLVRVDPERPEQKQQRHVHVAQEKHKSVKSMQASWNEDGKRHDRGSFNEKLGGQAAYKTAARAALGLPSDITLEWINPRPSLVMLCEAVISPEPPQVILMSTRVLG